jgi:hypothetical protein
LALIQIFKNLEGRIDPASRAILGTTIELEIGVEPKKTHELRLATIGMYYVQPIFKDFR